jgi:GMP synthase-like glutamine amidotransferase
MSSPIKQYTQLKQVSLILYSKKETSFEFLLFKFPHEGVFDIFNNEITLLDNGSIYSIARFMTINFPGFFTKKFFETFPKSEIFPPKKIHNYKLWENETFIFWLDNLSQNLIQYDDFNEEIIYFYEIPYINLEELNTLTEKINYKTKFIYINKNTYNNELSISFQLKKILETISLNEIESYIKNSIEKREKGEYENYIILGLKTQGKDQTGFFHFPALFQSLYRKNNENWIYINVASDGLPDDKLIEKTKGIIIPGSNLSVNDNYDFLKKTEIFLKKLIEDILFNNKYPKLKILGICFGLQIICKSLNGKIIKMENNSRIGKPNDIILNMKFWDFNFVKNSKIEKKNKLRISQAHSENVDKLPEEKYNFEIYAKSDSCDCEIVVDKNEKIFMLQGHPEYIPEFNINRAASFFSQDKSDEGIQNTISQFLNDEFVKNVDFEDLRKLCVSFLKN